jgi:GrpB-like predicted nucleotidyltransferase (UPF0157 family)
MTASVGQAEPTSEIGLKQGHVRIVSYNRDWPDLFRVARDAICKALGDPSLDVQHVGSTAVAGIDAKPIIDMVMGVEDPNGAEPRLRPVLEALGWELRYVPVLTGNRLFFANGEPCTHHLHVVERDSDDLRDMLLFRDFVREHPDVAAEYCAFKKVLARKFATERESYTTGKGPFIQAALAVIHGDASLEEFVADIPRLTLQSATLTTRPR